ncbi:MAG: hypothetical protein WAX77_04170 [Methylococcaceae bacterium]
MDLLAYSYQPKKPSLKYYLQSIIFLRLAYPELSLNNNDSHQ